MSEKKRLKLSCQFEAARSLGRPPVAQFNIAHPDSAIQSRLLRKCLLLQELPTTTERLQTRASKGGDLKNARVITRENEEARGVGAGGNAGFGGAALARPDPESAPALGKQAKKPNR